LEVNPLLVLEKKISLLFQVVIQIPDLENDNGYHDFRLSPPYEIFARLECYATEILIYRHFSDCLTLEDESDKVSRNFGK
jgi:hypothetical protein